ncbi:MAG: tetratricopeptide repeat protein [Candidatus Obscuribacter phosphatis]|uniref:Tetratricopeptide repeat protein n=1 Tax=Candidatus Obscuribacter phosphatis TaxID=1906157 RepID=A0A8J7TKS0_9BACT|nr:tetratricopeptide repeat protein [Candidatus Obscuribacter phosphatis]
MEPNIKALIDKGLYSDAQTALREQLVEKQKEFGPDEPQVAALQLQLGDFLFMCGSSIEAEKVYEDLISANADTGKNTLFVVNAYRSIAKMYVDQGNFTAAQQKFDSALKLIEQLDEPGRHLLTYSLKIDRAELYRAQGSLEKAEKDYDSLLKSTSQETRDTDVADLLVRLGNLYVQWNKYERAEEKYHEALERLIPYLLPDEPAAMAALQSLAVLYLRQGEGDKSTGLYLKLFDWLDKHQKTIAPVARTHMELALANIYDQRGISKDAEQWYLTALESMKGVLAEQFDFASAHQDLGELYRKQGKTKEAKEHLQEAMEAKGRAFGVQHPGVAAIQANLAELYSKQGENDKAIELLTNAVDTFRTSLGSEHQTVVELSERLRQIQASKS